MTVAPTLSLDVLLNVASHLGARDLVNLGATQQALKELFTNRAFIVALTHVPFDHDLKPVTYALQNGDIQLLSKTMSVLDTLFPGWQWSKFYAKGVGRLLTLAAAHNLPSLQYLVHKYPLMPGPRDGVQANQVPAPVLAHDFYSVGGSYAPAMVSIRNWELVIQALKRDKYDCASFLLNHQPPLFPNGFPLRADPTCYSSPATLNFLLDRGAYVGVNPLHYIAETNPRDPQVFDVLVQRGFGIDSPLETLRHLPMWPTSTPLQKACQFLQPRSVEALLRLGANPNGVASRFFIHKVPLMGGFQYSSPLPILTLLLSSRWVSPDLQSFGRRLVDCFQLLLHYGATTSIPLLRGHLLEIFTLRVWRVLYTQATREPNFVLPQIPDRPGDVNQGVQSFLFALNDMDVAPWDHVCQVFSDGILHGDAGLPRGKERLIQLLSNYQNRFGDLPGPAQLQQSSLLILPDRYLVSATDSA
ncbi:hypothetical protein FHL15_009548 [Xylaria flabelliformis]|uniref:Uncharacterized protein n=1 Tax=Xylaria flabelliformis TaxID=2512241 RepID=A0A553HNG2_9PEZI|nr:hypothetical protein FHL15_009548 [Xylaria flabelliformis]